MKSIMMFLFSCLIFSHFVTLTQSQEKSRTAGDRTHVDLTIYNQNLSLIREERIMNFEKGIGRIVIPDIPATIDGTSLHFSSRTDPLAVRVLEQNYQYDLVSQSKILEKYIGKEIQFVRQNEETKKEYTVTGKLLAAGMQSPYQPNRRYSLADGMVAEINGKLEINPDGRLILPDLPEGLILKPQLEWLVECTHPGKHETEISYLAGQLSWSADYVALLDSNDTHLDMTGWVTVTNNCGTSFNDAGLKLVAGDVNLVQKEFEGVRPMAKGLETAENAPQFKQSELFEYKLYTLQRRTNLKNDETKQIELVSGKRIPSVKQFIYDGLADQWRYWFQNPSYRNNETFGQQSNTKVGVYVTFRNDGKSGLGIPLPKGKVRVYKRDEEGKEQFIGENQIDHTPKDEELRLYLGNAFDIVGERAQVDFKSSQSGRMVEETVRIKVRNHKSTGVEVQIYEHPWRWSQWEITSKSVDFVKVDQSTIRFPVRIAKDEEKVVTYTIRYTW